MRHQIKQIGCTTYSNFMNVEEGAILRVYFKCKVFYLLVFLFFQHDSRLWEKLSLDLFCAVKQSGSAAIKVHPHFSVHQKASVKWGA